MSHKYPAFSNPRIVCIKCVSVVRVHFSAPCAGMGTAQGVYRYNVAVECKCGRKFGEISPFTQGNDKIAPKLKDDLTTKDIDEGYIDRPFKQRIDSLESEIRRDSMRLGAMRWANGAKSERPIFQIVSHDLEVASVEAPTDQMVTTSTYDGEYVISIERVASMQDDLKKGEPVF